MIPRAASRTRLLARLRAAILGTALAIAGLQAAPAFAADRDDLAALQARDARLFATGWRLVTGNAPFCSDARPAAGMLLHDAAAYGDPQAVRRALGLSGDIAVQAVAPGSPAEKVGLKANDTLVRIGETEIATVFPPGQPAWQRLVDLSAAIDDRLARAPLGLAWRSDPQGETSARLIGVPACPSRFEVLDSGKRAVADGSRVLFGIDFSGFALPDDEFAAAVAHELAHNLLRHRALLDREGRKQRLVRLTERDADRLMPWLLANAGYDPRAARRMMADWGRKHDAGLFRKRTHDGWDERLELIDAEIAIVEGLMAEHGRADWARHFTRHVDGRDSAER